MVRWWRTTTWGLAIAALVATLAVAGLAAAIPAVMAYNHFANRVGEFESELEGFGNVLVGWMAREGLL